MKKHKNKSKSFSLGKLIKKSWRKIKIKLFKNTMPTELKTLLTKLPNLSSSEGIEAIESFLTENPEYQGEDNNNYARLVIWAIKNDNSSLAHTLLKRYQNLTANEAYPKGLYKATRGLTMKDKTNLDFQLAMLGIDRDYSLEKKTRYIQKCALMIEYHQIDLLEKFLQSHQHNQQFNINSRDRYDWPCLFIALEKDDMQAFALLVKYGADLNIRLHLPLAELKETSIEDYVNLMPAERKEKWRHFLQKNYDLMAVTE